MPSGGFPKTVATEAELVERMGRIPEYTFGAPSIRRRVQPGILYKAISSKMFKKERESTENGSPLAFFTSTEEAAADAERLARSSFDISAPDGNAPFKFSSTSTLNAYVGSSVLPPLSGSVGCLANAGTWRDASDGGNALREEESKLTPVPAIFRKRTCSSPSSNPSTATLRRINFQTHTRTRSDGRLALEGDQGDATCHRITIALPAGRPPMILKIVATTVMENILLYTCNTCGLDFEKFTLEAAGGLVDVQLDRNVNYYAAVRGISDFAVVEKEKHYSLKWVTEDGKDTMVLQLIEKEYVHGTALYLFAGARNGSWVVMAATEDKLIERVTDGSLPPDYEFIDTVLLTFRSFMRPAEFFDRLVARFNAELPENAKPDDVQYFEKVKGPTQLRCIVTLEWWIEHYFQDFAEDKELRDDLADVVVQISGHLSYAERANRLKGLIEKKVCRWRSWAPEHFSSVFGALGTPRESLLMMGWRPTTGIYGSDEISFPVSWRQVESHENLTREHSRNSNRKSMESMVSLAMFTPEDLAQQLCLHDFELFRRIEAVEYLNHILGKT
ncbi:MAG: ras guanine nucleotide exchange factor domain-containing protein, partial [Olpidium bornovanus]